MIKFKMWDKKSDVFGISATEYLADNIHLQNGDVFITYNCDVEDEIQSVNLIRKMLSVDESLSSEQVAQKYVDNANVKNLQLPEQVQKLKEQEDKISILEAENAQMQYAMMMGGLL